MIDLNQAARTLCGEVAQGQVRCPGPGHSSEDRSLCVKFDPSYPEGFLIHSFAGDDPMACRDYVRERLGLERTKNPTFASIPRTYLRDNTEFAIKIWHEGIDPFKTPTDRYLVRRGLILDEALAGLVIRHHPSLRYEGQSLPAMIALMRDIRTDEPTGIIRTFLSPDGNKIDRRMLGRAKGSAVKLDTDSNVAMGLTIGEGVESALSGRQLGYRPCWALGSAQAIGTFPVLSGIEGLTILAENDDSGTNAKQSARCIRRWNNADVEVLRVEPTEPGDMNDVIQRTRYEQPVTS